MPFTEVQEEPGCYLGYTSEQVRRITGERQEEFEKWMSGQTVALCDARKWNPSTETLEPSGCSEAHGVVTYVRDLHGFLNGSPIWD